MILVTGAQGFIGSSLMHALAQRNVEARPLEHNINAPYQLEETLEGIDTVIHLASAEHRGRGRALIGVDVLGTERLVTACAGSDIRLILVSRIGADPNAMYTLLRAKGQQEQLIRQSGLDYTIIRSATLYGRFDRFLNNIVSLAAWTWPIVVLPGGGTMAVQPLWVEDLVQILLLTLDRPKLSQNTIEVAGEERMSYASMVDIALKIANLARRPIRVHPLVLRPVAALIFGWWRRPAFNPFFLQRLAVPDITELDAVSHHFGFRPHSFIKTIPYLRRSGHRRRLFWGD